MSIKLKISRSLKPQKQPPRVTVWSLSATFCEFFVKTCCPLLSTLVSGSPIIQNGKLVGAVTHVMVNDPTVGYGIFIENMLKQMGDLAG